MPNVMLKDAFAIAGPPEETLEEPLHGKVLDPVALPPLTRRERWATVMMRMGLSGGDGLLREKLHARRLLVDLPARFGSTGGGLNHPTQLAPYLESLTDLPESLQEEGGALESSIAALLIEYRFKHSIQRGLMCYYSKLAKQAFMEGYKKQKMVGKIDDPDELAQVLDGIRKQYLQFIRNYVYAVVTREDVLKGEPLFGNLLTAFLFLSRIGAAGTLDKEPNGRRLPSRSCLLFVALRDPVLLKAAENIAFQRKLSRSIKDFPAQEASP